MIINLTIKWWKGNGDRADMWYGYWWCNRLCLASTGHSLVAPFFYPCRLRTIRCMDPSQVTDLLSRAHTCLWEREGLLLSYHGLRLFPDWLIGGGDRWRSKHHIETGPQVWELGVQVWTGTWNPWQEWNGLVSLVPGVQVRRVFFRGTQLGTLIRESSFLRDGLAWLRSGTIVRIDIWKMKKWLWLLNPYLNIE
jgi:hypothetical protein